jgi:hypothetical protein
VPNDTSCRSTRSAVTGHVTCDATDYIAPLMHPLAFAEAPVPAATPNTSNATSIFIINLLEPAGLSRESRLFGSFARSVNYD